MITKVISGGQTGADQGALDAARARGVATGGWMPRGFLTEAGPRPDFKTTYGMQEHRSALYPPRTRKNVKESDGTIWVGSEATSPGWRCTVAAAEYYAKPILRNPTAQIVRSWAKQWGVRTLNVAGTRASRDARAYARANALVLDILGGDDE